MTTTKTEPTLTEIIAEYDRIARENDINTPWSVLAEVAEDDTGEVYYEVVQVAVDLGADYDSWTAEKQSALSELVIALRKSYSYELDA